MRSPRRDGRLPAAAVILLAAALAAAGCSGGVTTYGDMSRTAGEIDIETLLDAPELHLGEEVQVSGHVVQVCQEMGCWFEIMDEGRRLMIDLEMGREFTVPEGSAGAWAVVIGTFVRQDGVLKVLGHGVELMDSPRQPAVSAE